MLPSARRLRINRFTVMAMLQAARAERLGLSSSSARSWGLNRAIFYAAAKRGFRSKRPEAGAPEGAPAEARETEAYHLGNELAYRDPKSSELRFMIGGKVQTDSDFDREIAARFGSKTSFRAAWTECEKLVGAYDREVLGSQREFYANVYKPRRDQLVQEWNERFGKAAS